jgi:formamidopyrimidine-DNA glycosylase
MPELPEVETVARLIRPRVLGRTIVASQATWLRSLGGSSAAAFDEQVRGCTITHVGRRAKYIIVTLGRAGPGSRVAGGAVGSARAASGLEPAGALLVHLRMTGRLHVELSTDPLGPYTRVALPLDDGHTLRFDDVRKFGRFTFVEDPTATLSHLGPEPLSDEFTGAWLRAALRRRKRKLKPLLLDQEFVAGLGNIYVDESLHAAGIHPLQPAARVPKAKALALHAAVRRILAAAVEREGSSFDAFYRTPEGQPGAYQHLFQVYGREGQPCPRCGSTIRRIVVGQRGTHLCRRCQPRPRV